MPVTKPRRVRTIDRVVIGHSHEVDDAERSLDAIAQRVTPQAARKQQTVDLVVGANRINHNLGKTPTHVTLMPTVVDASFAWAVTAKTDTQVTITVVGIDQPGASIEVS